MGSVSLASISILDHFNTKSQNSSKLLKSSVLSSNFITLKAAMAIFVAHCIVIVFISSAIVSMFFRLFIISTIFKYTIIIL